MAERRMFTKKVTDDDNFMSLSASAQALYLHLSMSADDDGFCNQVSIAMFKAHASIQDLEALLSKRYIYQFENGVIVIKHWRMANALRKDRYTPTAFQEELKQLKIKDNGSYTMQNEELVAIGLPCGCQVSATDKDRLDKDSIGEYRLGKESIDKDSIGEITFPQEIVDLYALYCPSLPSVMKLTDKRKKSIRALLKAYSIEQITEGFRKAEASDFCKGFKGGWKADFDFLINQNNMTKVLEGKYDNRDQKAPEQNRGNRFLNA